MAAQAASGTLLPFGVNSANFYAVIVICAALAAADTLDVTLPDGVPKDALPIGEPQAYLLAADTYTADPDFGVAVTTHQRVTGVTRLTVGGNGIAAGTKLLMLYVGTG